MIWLAPFLGGLAGSLHCVGMCGGFALALRAAGARTAGRQVVYQLGRVQALAGLGAVCGTVGAAVVASGPALLLERALALFAGAAMVVVGLEMLGVLGAVLGRWAAAPAAALARWIGAAARSPSPFAPLALGALNAFLPCHLVWAFAAQAAATADPLRGVVVMLAFGLGTVPALLAVGLGGTLVAPAVRARVVTASALLVVGLGALTFARGFTAVAMHHHH